MTLSLARQNAYRAEYQARRPDWRPATEVYESLIRAHLKPDASVLDLGCGRGGVLEQLGDAVDHAFGFDPDFDSLREHRVPQLPRAVALSEHLPLRDNTIDIVTCSWVLEHLEQPAQVFAEIKRVLRPGGCFIFLTPNATSLVAWMNRTLKPLQQMLVPRLYGRAESDTFPVRYRANTRSQIIALATQTGLQCETLCQIEDPTYLAFSPLLFHLSMALSRYTPPVHLVGTLRKDSNA
ncbi:MAG: methyltransferase domain-containing protein [Chloroflexota bacterium]